METRPVEIGPAGLHTALSRTGRTRRRCDIDELVIATVLGVPPTTLLPPPPSVFGDDRRGC
ncbi:XRE family transcriptional regulator [Streptomyces sp. WAC04770]|nr:XRE family transcriptional regulator [Streptomyces sp. WAC04770]